MSLLRNAVLPCLCVCLAACKSESVPDVITRHRPAVEKTFAAMQTLQVTVAATTKFTATKVKAPAVPLVLERPGTDDSNAMFIYAADLPRPGEARKIDLRTLDSTPLLQCGSLLNKQQYFADSFTRPMPTGVEGYLTACARVKYALVIRPHEFVAPRLTLETRSFASGLYRADVLVFELSSAELLGGYPVSAKNEDAVMLLAGDENHVQRLVRNLESTVYSAFREGAQQAFPGAVPPPPAK